MTETHAHGQSTSPAMSSSRLLIFSLLKHLEKTRPGKVETWLEAQEVFLMACCTGTPDFSAQALRLLTLSSADLLSGGPVRSATEPAVVNAEHAAKSQYVKAMGISSTPVLPPGKFENASNDTSNPNSLHSRVRRSLPSELFPFRSLLEEKYQSEKTAGISSSRGNSLTASAALELDGLTALERSVLYVKAKAQQSAEVAAALANIQNAVILHWWNNVLNAGERNSLLDLLNDAQRAAVELSFQQTPTTPTSQSI